MHTEVILMCVWLPIHLFLYYMFVIRDTPRMGSESFKREYRSQEVQGS